MLLTSHNPLKPICVNYLSTLKRKVDPATFHLGGLGHGQQSNFSWMRKRAEHNCFHGPIGVMRIHQIRLDQMLIRQKEKGETFGLDEDLAGLWSRHLEFLDRERAVRLLEDGTAPPIWQRRAWEEAPREPCTLGGGRDEEGGTNYGGEEWRCSSPSQL
jgi:hypothetical protein